MSMQAYTEASTFQPDYALKPRQHGGALHIVHPNHPGVAFCGAEVGDPLPADAPARRRPWCRSCRGWYGAWKNQWCQDAYWDEEMTARNGSAPFRGEDTEAARAEWRDKREQRAQQRKRDPREVIAEHTAERRAQIEGRQP